MCLMEKICAEVRKLGSGVCYRAAGCEASVNECTAAITEGLVETYVKQGYVSIEMVKMLLPKAARTPALYFPQER